MEVIDARAKFALLEGLKRYIEDNHEEIKQELDKKCFQGTKTPFYIGKFNFSKRVKYLNRPVAGLTTETAKGMYISELYPDYIADQMSKAFNIARATPEQPYRWIIELPTAKGVAIFEHETVYLDEEWWDYARLVDIK